MNSSGLQTLQNSHFFTMGGLGGCPQNLNQFADRDEMPKRNRKQKPLLSKLEEDIALLNRHEFEVESLEEMRQSLLKQFICLPELSQRQKNAVHKLATPLRTKAKSVKTTRRRKKHYVYAITDGAFLKIGLALDPSKRMAELQVASPSFLEVMETIECQRYGDASRLEKKIHRACKKFHVRGEWFEMDALMVFDKFNQAKGPE